MHSMLFTPPPPPRRKYIFKLDRDTVPLLSTWPSDLCSLVALYLYALNGGDVAKPRMEEWHVATVGAKAVVCLSQTDEHLLG